jgi:putative NADH-flavin reductase
MTNSALARLKKAANLAWLFISPAQPRGNNGRGAFMELLL